MSLDIEPGTNSGTLNRLVRVFNSAGVEVTSNRSGATTNANLNFIADTAGSYFVGVSDLGNANYNPNVAGSGNTADAATGDYLLNLKITPLGDVGDTLATAAPVSFLRDPSTHSGTPGSISRPLDVDLYSVTLVAGDTLHLSVLSDASKGDALVDLPLRLFDSAGNQIDSAVSNAGTNVPALTEAITTPGTYYVGVSSADNSNYNPLVANSGTAGSTGDYQLVVRVNSASSVSAEVEPNNVIGRPNVIGANANVAGAIGTAGDADFYMFNVTAPGLFTAAVNADAGSSLNARLTLFGPDQTPWQTSDDQAAGNQNPLITANLVPGTYFLKVESSAPSGTSLGATGAYHLQTKLVAAASAFDANTTGNFSPTVIASGDFNGDHIPDLLVTNSNHDPGLVGDVYRCCWDWEHVVSPRPRALLSDKCPSPLSRAISITTASSILPPPTAPTARSRFCWETATELLRRKRRFQSEPIPKRLSRPISITIRFWTWQSPRAPTAPSSF